MKPVKILAAVMSAVLCIVLCAVNVSADAKKGISLDKTSVTMTVGNTEQLTASVSGIKKYTRVWSSSNKKIVTVAAGGKLTAVKAGTATITVKIKGTSYKATCKVTVKDVPASMDKTDAFNFVKKLKIGWNLGNTLDSLGGSGVSAETSWGNIKTTEKMIKTVKAAGFNTVRIPVSWSGHIDAKGNIDKAWLDRVQEVVDYGIDNGMYVILNSHHDNSWRKLTPADEKAVTATFTTLWKQISTRFKKYDEHLIFEGMNEPRTEGSAKEWNGGTAEERKVVNNLNQAFVDTVRSTGGKNKTRFLMITPYAATSSSVTALKELEIPDDSRIIVSVHSYTPYNLALNTYSDEAEFTAQGKKDVDSLMRTIKTHFIDKGVPVILGEFGSINKNNSEERAKLAKYYVHAATKIGVPCIWWDNGSNNEPSEGVENLGLLNRKTLEWWYKDILDALMAGLE